MCVELGPLIASGRTADVYARGTDQVVKLFHPWFGLDDICFEQKVAQAVQGSGLPVPVVGEIIQVKGRNGLLYQRVEGNSMWASFSHQPWRIYAVARRSAALHARLHATVASTDLPDQQARLRRKIKRAKALPDEIRQRALLALDKLPAGDRICHGDFHPGNILVTTRGEVIIDWIDASRGNPPG